MPAINIDFPDAPLFQTSITVQIGDINYGNHLANDAVLRLCHEARIRWLATHGLTELDAGGTGLIMNEAALQYTAQAHHGDELLIDLAAGNINRSGFTLFYRISRPKDSKTIAKIQTGMVSFDYAAQKVSRLPEPLRMILMPV
ncbi:acyl-CoA thioesterase [Neisseria wadsworthii]|uniref:Esterase n=1 Tax=Neisseria wadsworthii 9715 TaxID=1030841 RepID=G4CQN4_9NEIS|nr:thioesterase family protein [Neisseria wadsworthii]EGZ46295.1 esterase [Neisseria wadsworthii 9715]QMT35134.1 acyl-CoA thioesterase [Neisseria wadsworthii]